MTTDLENTSWSNGTSLFGAILVEWDRRVDGRKKSNFFPHALLVRPSGSGFRDELYGIRFGSNWRHLKSIEDVPFLVTGSAYQFRDEMKRSRPAYDDDIATCRDRGRWWRWMNEKKMNEKWIKNDKMQIHSSDLHITVMVMHWVRLSSQLSLLQKKVITTTSATRGIDRSLQRHIRFRIGTGLRWVLQHFVQRMRQYSNHKVQWNG